MTARRLKYETWRKRLVQTTITQIERPFTVKDVYSELSSAKARVSRATVYRILGALCAEGVVREVFLPDGRRICANSAQGRPLCIIECMCCGKLVSCDATSLDQGLKAEAERRLLSPLQTSAYMQATCHGCKP